MRRCFRVNVLDFIKVWAKLSSECLFKQRMSFNEIHSVKCESWLIYGTLLTLYIALPTFITCIHYILNTHIPTDFGLSFGLGSWVFLFVWFGFFCWFFFTVCRHVLGNLWNLDVTMVKLQNDIWHVLIEMKTIEWPMNRTV